MHERRKSRRRKLRKGFRNPEDLHAVSGVGAAGDEGFFFLAVLDPDLAVEAFAVPAEVGFGDLFYVEILQAAEDGIVLRDELFLAENGDLDKAVVGFQDVVELVHFVALRLSSELRLYCPT